MKRFRRRDDHRSLTNLAAARALVPGLGLEPLEARALLVGSLAGVVYDDVNTNQVFDPGTDVGIAGVSLVLSGAATPLTATTRVDGSYTFANVPAGTYELDETQPAGYNQGVSKVPPGGGTSLSPDRIGSVVVADGVDRAGYDFTEASIKLTGVVFLDANGDGTQQSTEAGLAGGSVVIRSVTGQILGTTTSSSTGAYTFAPVAPGDYTLNFVPPAGYGASAPDFQSLTVTTTGATAKPFGATIGSVAGSAFLDVNSNGIRDRAEVGLVGTQVRLQGTDATGATVDRVLSIGTAGTYSFGSVLAGTYSLTRSIPAGTVAGTTVVGTLGGTTSASGVSGLTLTGGGLATGYTFAYLGAAITGAVFVDTNSNQLLDPTELGTPGVTVRLENSSGTVVATTTTAADGTYAFAPASGTYTVELVRPAGFGATTATTSSVTFTSGTASPNIDYGLSLASLSGTVFLDANNNRTKDTTEVGIAGVALSLTGSDRAGNSVTRTATTGSDGTYTFASLVGGVYTLSETQPTGFSDGLDNVGASGGVFAAPDQFTQINVNPGVAATGYTFGERGATLAGTAFLDDNRDGVRQAGEPGQSGIVVVLQDASGTPVSTATTASDGTYSFANLRSGSYRVVFTPSSIYGTTTPTTLDVTVPLAGLAGQDFGLSSGSLGGTVFVDLNKDGVFQVGEPGISGVPVTLYSVATGGLNTGIQVDATTTDANGSFRFTRLAAGTTYRIVESGPSTYDDGNDVAGGAGGTVIGSDDIRGIIIGAGQDATGYNFGELSRGLSGRVFVDRNGNGTPDAGEIGIPGVTVNLVGPTSASTITDSQGQYEFDRALFAASPGSYTVVESPPNGYLTVSNPTSPAFILPDADNAGTRVEFALKAGSLAGSAFVDLNGDGIRSSDEPGIPGISVRLTGLDVTGSSIDRTLVTGSDGSYIFNDLAASSSAGYSIAETQPTNRRDGRTGAGTLGGSAAANLVSAISLAPGADGTGYTFGELNSSLSGRVYVDTNRDNTFSTGESGLGGVVISLIDTNNVLIATATTAADGTYTIGNVNPGPYAIVRTLPLGYGSTNAGSTNVTVSNADLTTNDFPVTVGSLAGVVFLDVNGDGVRQAATERGIGSVAVTLTGTNVNGQAVSLSTSTATDGTYTFAGLISGSYSLIETQPPVFLPGQAAAGTAGGVPSTDGNSVLGIGFGPAVQATGYTFAEINATNASISGTVYNDANGDGQQDNGEVGIAGVLVLLTGTNSNGVAVQLSATTDSAGAYSFTGLLAGVYNIREFTPSGFEDGAASIGTAGGMASTAGLITGIALGTGQAATGYNFGERTGGGSLSGYVYLDSPRNRIRNPKDLGVRGVKVVLKGRDSFGTILLRRTRTAADGSYTFSALPAGTYQITVGQPTSLRPERRPNVGTQGGAVLRINNIGGIVLAPNQSGRENNFPELAKAGQSARAFLTRTTGLKAYHRPANVVRTDLPLPEKVKAPSELPNKYLFRAHLKK